MEPQALHEIIELEKLIQSADRECEDLKTASAEAKKRRDAAVARLRERIREISEPELPFGGEA